MCDHGPPRGGNGGGDTRDRRMALNKRTGHWANWDARNPESGGGQEGNGGSGSRGAQPWWRSPFTATARLVIDLALHRHKAYS